MGVIFDLSLILTSLFLITELHTGYILGFAGTSSLIIKMFKKFKFCSKKYKILLSLILFFIAYLWQIELLYYILLIVAILWIILGKTRD